MKNHDAADAADDNNATIRAEGWKDGRMEEVHENACLIVPCLGCSS